MKELLGIVVRILHYLILAFSVFAPIFGNEFWLSMHVIAMPTMMFHWITNQNVCSLTLLESKLRGRDCNKTFISEVLYPFFSMSNDRVIYTLTFVWWLIALYKLKTQYDFNLLRMCFALIWNTLKNTFGFITNSFY